MSRLERWSRRKLGEEPSPDAPPPEEAPPKADQADSPQAEAEPHSVSDDDLPDPESLPPGSDFSRYLQEGVSQALRRRALRRLWQADHYQIRDGLDDYDGDYSQLEPLAREAAERLRHWGRRVNDYLDPEEETAEERLAEEVDSAQAQGAEPPVDEERAPSAALDEGDYDAPERLDYISKNQQ
ncbi:DUF3306 domain-containing protein [Halomonas mongoliensis]|uniref:DUF3306 domain-containing protein n=1 Tax=Halomonas mongoliensis TaxID=321265 RepID=UPI00403AD172